MSLACIIDRKPKKDMTKYLERIRIKTEGVSINNTNVNLMLMLTYVSSILHNIIEDTMPAIDIRIQHSS